MERRPVREIQLEREHKFESLVGASMQRDFAAIDEAVRSDVVAEMPGSSWLAGTQRGHEALGRQVAALRQVLRPSDSPNTYAHEGDQMTVRHQTQVMGPQHQVEMTLQLKIRFDAADGKIASSVLVPEDLGLFDHVVNSTLRHLQVH
jgi:ketosteroid isomerase-like protein